MSKSLKIRSTDLNVLRSLLMNDDKIEDTNEENTNIINFNDNLVKEDYKNEGNKNAINYDFANVDNNLLKENLNAKSFQKKNILLQPKEKSCVQSEKKPFLITRINTLHKLPLEKDENKIIEIKPDQNKYKSIYYKNITQKEENLQQKYSQLAKILDKDVVSRTAAICDQSMNEARQLIQSSLAASRIVSSFLIETQGSLASDNIDKTTEKLFPFNDFSFLPSTSSSVVIDRKKSFPFLSTELRSVNRSGDSCKENIDNIISEEMMYNFDGLSKIKENVHPPEANTFTSSYGYDIDEEQQLSKKIGIDHKLDSNKPFIQHWLQSKNKEEERQRRLERREIRIEKALSLNAERVLKERKTASEDAFKSWCKQKTLVKKLSSSRSEVSNNNSSSCSEEDSLPQAGRQPRPTKNYPYKRPQFLSRPITAASINIRCDNKMKLKGEKMELVTLYTPHLSTRLQPNLLGNSISNKCRPQTAVPQARPKTFMLQTLNTRNKPVIPKRQLEKSKKKKKKSTRFIPKETFLQNSDDRENTRPQSVGDLYVKDEIKQENVRNRGSESNEELSRSVSIASLMESYILDESTFD